MNLLKVLVIGLTVAGLTVGVHQRRSAASPHCHTVNQRISTSFDSTNCTSPVGLCTAGAIQGSVLNGTTHYITEAMTPAATAPGDEPVWFSYAGLLTVTTPRGTVTLNDKGELAYQASGPFAELAPIGSGTGDFAQATGTLFISGFVTADASGFDGTIQGQICGIDGDGDEGDG